MNGLQNGVTSSIQTVKSNGNPLSNRAKLKFVCLVIFVFLLLSSILLLTFSNYQHKQTLGVILSRAIKDGTSDSLIIIHPFPDTSEGIHIFNDQLATWEMSEAQFEFAANHYVGTQKIFASDARRLRSYNPKFVILNYRLGLGLGYQTILENCEPSGAWLEVIEGEKWIREYPENPPEQWFYQKNGQRVLFCDWGWYLMDISNPSWREYWAGEVLRQLQTNKADGIFVDSLFPPNYYGGDKFNPNLPVLDQAFENTWSSYIESFIKFGQSGDLAEYYFIPNAGQWLTGRDNTDYSGADGVLVEGFGRWTNGDHFSIQDGDWQLQMDRILNLVNLDKIVLLQQYVNKLEDKKDRTFLLANYLIIKGQHTFLNLEFSFKPEWFPEYEIPIGTPIGGIPASISSLWRPDWDVYARSYSNGLVVVNPFDQPKEVDFKKTYYQANPVGGGIVPDDGDISSWKINYSSVTSIRLDPYDAVILLDKLPTQ